MHTNVRSACHTGGSPRASPYGCKLRSRSHGVSQPWMMGDGAAASGCNAELYVVGTHPLTVRRVALIERVELQACCARVGDDIPAAGRLHAGRYPAPRGVRVVRLVVGLIVSAVWWMPRAPRGRVCARTG